MPRPRERVRLEDGLKLSLPVLLRQQLIRDGAHWGSTIVWHYRYTGEEIARGRVSADLTGGDHGIFRIQLGDLDQRLKLQAEPRRLGGVQWYFACPETGGRASVLWLPPGASGFASRQAYGRQVAYASQFLRREDRAARKAEAISFRLGGGEWAGMGMLAPKPKWMRWNTYERLAEEYWHADDVLQRQIDASSSGITERD